MLNVTLTMIMKFKPPSFNFDFLCDNLVLEMAIKSLINIHDDSEQPSIVTTDPFGEIVVDKV